MAILLVSSLDLLTNFSPIRHTFLMQKATRQQTKEHNSRLVYKSIYDGAEISRADIARSTGLTKTTVSSIVVDLMGEGLVEESGYGTSDGGKPPILLRAVDEARHYMGLDLAGSIFRGATLNLRGEIKKRAHKPVENSDGETALSVVYELIDQLLTDSEVPVRGIGVGAPGLINPVQGVVRRSVNLDWRDLHLRELLEDRYNLPCYIANDCQAAALGEYTFGENNQTTDLAVVKVGRGIGSGIVMNGALFFGQGYGAGEIGHLVVVDGDEICACGNRGCLETMASTQAIIKQAKEIALNDPKSYLNQIAASPEVITIIDVLEAFRAGDPNMQKIIIEAGRHLGAGMASLVSVLNVRHIVIAGSIARFGETLLEAIKGELVNRSMSIMAEDTEVYISSLGQEIVIKGAASLVLANEMHLV